MATKKTDSVDAVVEEVIEEQIVEITPPVVEQELANYEELAKQLSLQISKLRSLVNETERVVALSPYGAEPAILTTQIKAIIGE